MARTAEHVTAVDYFDGRGTSIKAEGGFRTLFDESLRRHGVTEKVAVCHPENDALPLEQYDLVFIDGAHDVDSVRADIQRALSVIAPDGLIAFHDYKIGIDKGVDAAVDEFLETGAVLVSQTKSIAVVKPPAAILLEV
jgi:predicted O-methyltransferase YrrM